MNRRKTITLSAMALGLTVLAFFPSCSIRSDTGFGRVRFSPDGSIIVLSFRSTGTSDLFLMRPDGSGLKRLTETVDPKHGPSFSPDGKTIVYASIPTGGKGSQIYRMDADGGNAQRLTENEFCDAEPSFSPEGKKICFLRAHTYRPYSMGGWTWDHWDLYTTHADGTNEKRVTTGKHYGMDSPYFSPAGDRILFAANINGVKNHEVFIVDADGVSPPVRLTEGVQMYPSKHASISSDPSFSPDGTRIVFVSNRVSRRHPYDYEIWIINADGTNPRQVTRNQSHNSVPIFSPDGKWILFNSDQRRDGQSELWRVDVDGQDLRPLARTLPIGK